MTGGVATLRAMPDELREAIEKAGGLHTPQQLAARWGMTRQRASQLTSRSDFPEPVLVVGRVKLYAGCDADAWRAHQTGRRD